MTPSIRHLLFEHDPYLGFDDSGYELDLQGWNDNKSALIDLVNQTQPQLAVEVGSWKGLSAADIARHMTQTGELICVDTWLGSPEFFGNESNFEFDLKRNFGYPTIYYQFLANMRKLHLDHIVTPFPAHAAGAATWFRRRNITFDLIYIDATHEEGDVYQDLLVYHKLLAPHGLMCGDDYSEFWPGVRRAVDRFAVDNNLEVNVQGASLWRLQ